MSLQTQEILAVLPSNHHLQYRKSCQDKLDFSILKVMESRHIVGPNDTVEKVAKKFLKHHNLQSLAVVYQNEPIGIAYRHQLMDIFLRQYGHDLHGRKPITQFMDTNPLIVECDMPIEAASQYITQNMPIPTVQDFIIVKKGQYYGMGTVIELLKMITELKTQEYNQVLAQKVQELEKRTVELTIAHSQAQTATEHAKAANHAKSRFLANMSHELRTPINAIIGYTEILQEDAVDADYDNCSSDLQNIKKASTHLLGLIGNILDVSKIEAGKMDLYLETFNLSSAIQEVAAAMQPLIVENNNQLEVNCTYKGTIYADSMKIRQCLLNLLTNATKFSKNSKIELSAWEEIRDNQKWIKCSVRDYGIGMNQIQIDRLFEPFVQADNSATRQYGGTGLGLTIIKQFCELMGGTIDVESEYGKGSLFTVRLPIKVL
jgi:signal transduction histidine kinase